MVNSTDKEIADDVFKASNINTKYNVTHNPKNKYRQGAIKYIRLTLWVK